MYVTTVITFARYIDLRSGIDDMRQVQATLLLSMRRKALSV